MTKGEKYELVPTQNERENDFFFIFTLLFGASKRFYESWKIVFEVTFEAPERNVKMKIYVIFYFN